MEAVTARAGALLDGPSVPQIGMITVRPRPGESLAALARRLRAQAGVGAVAVEHRFFFREAPRWDTAAGESVAAFAANHLSLRDTPVALPDDPALSIAETAPGTPPGTPLEWWADREGLPQAWSITHGVGAKVAVIDSGVRRLAPGSGGQYRIRQ